MEPSSSSSNLLPLAINSRSAEFSSPSSPLTVRAQHVGIEVQAGFNPNLLGEIVRALDLDEPYKCMEEEVQSRMEASHDSLVRGSPTEKK
ncbi:hypothetical protein GCM10008018_25260 [Paenibacillus marchantiophytorum]|uniref:Uncharacterized protein n=1 Tax=Paenibacillus marchantiophytorum TaxID=1619310 RepID=A0ABQ1EMG5_9BACL|nr:hypothetical protein GCM10008018_25260 [Paenibacillus marchantiophytorum]